jgi:hypothetical protein
VDIFSKFQLSAEKPFEKLSRNAGRAVLEAAKFLPVALPAQLSLDLND